MLDFIANIWFYIDSIPPLLKVWLVVSLTAFLMQGPSYWKYLEFRHVLAIAFWPFVPLIILCWFFLELRDEIRERAK
jgi:hypothetical protein